MSLSVNYKEVDQSLSVPDMKRGSAEAFGSAPHLRDEMQGSKGPSVRVSLHFQPAGRGRAFIYKVFMKPVVYCLPVKALQKGLSS